MRFLRESLANDTIILILEVLGHSDEEIVKMSLQTPFKQEEAGISVKWHVLPLMESE